MVANSKKLVLRKNTLRCSSNISTPDRRQSKTLILSTNEDQKSLETGLSIATVSNRVFDSQMAIENTVSSEF